jgi:serine/threonine protein kinase
MLAGGTSLPHIALLEVSLMRMQLTVISGPDQGRTFALAPEQPLTIGRGADTTTKLQDPTVSRQHCVVDAAGGVARLIDSGGSGGVFVNRAKVTSVELKPGDVVQLGNTVMRLDVDLANETTMMGAPVQPAAPPPSADLSSLVGKKVHHYSVVRELARGNTGTVFYAKHDEDGRELALKVLWPELCRDEEQMQRFIRAMKTMLPVRHENIVGIYNAGKAGPHYWVAMEYVDGESLTQVIERIGLGGMLDWQYAFRVATHIGRALEAAHSHQIIHRNITPANILLRLSDKTAKLGDLMLAKALEGTAANQITKPGQLVGDLAYMSPERTRGADDVDCRSDIYGLGATVYALLTGHPPFVEKSLPALISRIRNEEPAKPSKKQLAIPPMFEGVVMQMLNKKPEDRFETPSDLLRDLDRVGKFHGVKL